MVECSKRVVALDFVFLIVVEFSTELQLQTPKTKRNSTDIDTEFHPVLALNLRVFDCATKLHHDTANQGARMTPRRERGSRKACAWLFRQTLG